MPSGITAGYAASAMSAIGQPFAIPLVAGSPGGIVYTLNVFDAGTAMMNADLLLFAAPLVATASAGSGLNLVLADWANFLGAIPVTGAWMSAGSGAVRCTVNAPGVAVISSGAQRVIYGQFQARSATTFGNTANPLFLTIVTLPD